MYQKLKETNLHVYKHHLQLSFSSFFAVRRVLIVPPITYYWTSLLILDHSYLVGNLTNSEIAEAKPLEPL